MPRYLQAFRAGQLRTYPGWPPEAVGTDPGPAADEIVYLDEALRVLRSPFDETSVLYEDASEEWRRFCAAAGYAPPDWETESAQVRAALASGAGDSGR